MVLTVRARTQLTDLLRKLTDLQRQSVLFAQVATTLTATIIDRRCCFNLYPILEPEPNSLPAVDGNPVHHRVSEDGVKLGNLSILLQQVVKELLYGFPMAGLVCDLSSGRFQPTIDPFPDVEDGGLDNGGVIIFDVIL